MGKAVAKQMARRQAIVILGCVDMHEGEMTRQEIQDSTGNPNVILMHLDLADMDAVQKFAWDVKMQYPRIKLLLNNAGLGPSPSENIKTKDGFNIHVAVNHMGHFLLTNLLESNLKAAAPSRVVSMSSGMQLFQKLDLNDINMDTSGFGNGNGLPYANTKYMNALFIKELGKRWKNSGVTTYALCPAGVKTQIHDTMTSNEKLIVKFLLAIGGFNIEQACSIILYCCLSKDISHETGLMYSYKRHFKQANSALKDDLAAKLWDLSANMVKLHKRQK